MVYRFKYCFSKITTNLVALGSAFTFFKVTFPETGSAKSWVSADAILLRLQIKNESRHQKE